MSANLFRDDVQRLLMLHPLNGNAPTRCGRGGSCDWVGQNHEHRRHLADLIAAKRDEHDQDRSKTPKHFTELLVEHAPFNMRGGGLACNTCVDGSGRGEFTSTTDWVQHIRAVMAKAGLKVVSS